MELLRHARNWDLTQNYQQRRC